jgi:glycerol uptake facilitator-like aquaporin
MFEHLKCLVFERIKRARFVSASAFLIHSSAATAFACGVYYSGAVIQRRRRGAYQLSRLAESSMALEHEWWKYFMIPWIAGFVGYATNVRKSLCIGRK